MGKAGGLEPFELVRATSDSGGPTALKPRTSRSSDRRLTLTVTPLGAFAAGALAVSSLALAWTLGRRAAEPDPRPPAAAGSLDQIRQVPPIPYNELPVDPGFAD